MIPQSTELGIYCVLLVISDGQSFTFDLSLDLAAAGPWTVVVSTQHLGSTSLTGGFTVMRPGDLDTNGDVESDDFERFMACFNGPNRPPLSSSPDCHHRTSTSTRTWTWRTSSCTSNDASTDPRSPAAALDLVRCPIQAYNSAMAAQQEPSSSERIKSFLWFSGIAILVALAILLWIRKSRSPAPSVLERSAQVAEQQRMARLLAEMQAAARMTQENDEARRREGLQKLQQLAEQNPDFPPAQQMLVQVALMLKDNALAERVARDIIKRSPESPVAHTLVALVDMAALRWPEATAELQKAIELNKQQGGEPQWNLHGLLAETYLKQGNIREADAQLREAANINLPMTAAQIAQSSLDLSERLGLILLVSGKPDEVVPAYRLLSGVAGYKKEDASAQYYAAAAALRAGQADEARTFLATAQKLTPDDPRFAKLEAEIARAPTTRRAATGPATQPTTTNAATPAR